MKRIVLIGFGAIGQEVARGMMVSRSGGYLVSVFLRDGSGNASSLPPGVTRLADVAGVLASSPDLVIEVAGHVAVRDIAPSCLESGIPVLITSIGALHDSALYGRLVAAAQAGQTRLILPSGALGGLDYVRAARHAPDFDVIYTSTKPPMAWRDELKHLGHDPDNLTDPVILFEGGSREAAALYPQNLNVAAALALSGPGFERTRVRIVCDPAAAGNSHVVTATSALGLMRIKLVNVPSTGNPKTSAIVSQSVLAAVEQFFSPVQVL